MEFEPVENTKLDPPLTFPFPFSPYSIQEELMRELYITLEGKCLGVFESPTGTGKSMSLICGSLKWLFDSEERKRNDIKSEITKNTTLMNTETDNSDWLNSHFAHAKYRDKRFELELLLKKITDSEEKIKDAIENAKQNIKDESCRKTRKPRPTYSKESRSKDDLKEDDEPAAHDDDVVIEESVHKELPNSDEENEEPDSYHCPKIFLCSRTHSQLSQLAGEIKKSPFQDLGVRVVPLASRQNLCVNDSVLRLKNLSLINETCQDLRSRKSCRATKTLKTGEKTKKQKTSRGCPFTSENSMEMLRAECLSEVHDIEELVSAGRDLSACPYYTSRNCIKDAHVVLLPYNTILHRNTREASGIDIRDSVVIIDEAHNLLDTLGNIHSSSVTGLQICHTHSFLTQYRVRFHDRFTAANLLSLNQLIFVLRKLIQRISPASKPEITTIVSRLSEFLLVTEIDNINMYNLIDFASRTRLANKLRGYVNKFQPAVDIIKKEEKTGVSAFLKKIQNKEPENDGSHGTEAVEPQTYNAGSSIQSVLTFLESLTNHSEDGRVVCVIGKTPAESQVKFLLLNPAAHFRDIISQARSVIVAGGTMQPFNEFTDQLFKLGGATPSRIRTFSCGHVVPPSNIMPIALANGPGGQTFDFSYTNRNNSGLMDDLGRLLINVCSVIPAGVVVFFPSYDYENKLYQYFKEKGVMSKLETKKKMFREPKLSSMVENVLSQYEKIAAKGAILFSVVGGKLSEGLNFSDDLGRCVIVVGLPYPNKTSPELQEKMAYLDQTMGINAGNQYYENLCMKAVNQSIGRSVRHIRDYASVLLLDHRYSRPKTKDALPSWIKTVLRCEAQFRTVMPLLVSFFNSKKLQKIL